MSEVLAPRDFERIGVVGGGLMGAGIADVCARAGRDVVVAETDVRAVDSAMARIRSSLARAVRSGKLDEPAADAAAERIRTTVGLDALADRNLVVEAVVEDEAAKVSIFADLDRVVEDRDAVLASNTPSIPIMKLGR